MTPVRAFFRKGTPVPPEAARAALRRVFALAFAVQAALVALTWLVVALAGARPAALTDVAGWTLLGLTVLLLPAAFVLAFFASRVGGKVGALSGAFALAVTLASPLWYVLFLGLGGRPSPFFEIVLAAVAAYAVLGYFQAGSYAALLAAPRGAKTPAPERESPPAP